MRALCSLINITRLASGQLRPFSLWSATVISIAETLHLGQETTWLAGQLRFQTQQRRTTGTGGERQTNQDRKLVMDDR
jgi:hypothetical protein